MFNKAAISSEQGNFHHLVREIAWFGLALPATARFLSVYAIRLDATTSELGWISSLPALVLLFSAALGSWWLHHYRNSVQAVFWPALAFRFIFLLPVFTPFLPVEWQPAWLILSVTLPALPQGIASVVFVVMMREAVNKAQLTSLLGKRALAMNVCVAIGALVFGLLLEKVAFPLNYQAMFVVAFVLALVSMLHIVRIRVNAAKTASQTIPQVTPEVLATAATLPSRPVKKMSPWRARKFQRVAIAAALLHLAFFSVFPITPLYLMDKMNASEGFMAIFAFAELAAAGAIALLADRIVRHYGNPALMMLSIVSTGLASLIIAFAPNLNVTLLAAALTGAGWTAAGIGLFSYFADHTPIEESTRYVTAYHQIIFLAMFIGPMLGTILANKGINLALVLLIGSILRIGSGLVIYFATEEHPRFHLPHTFAFARMHK
ncbi:MAG: MFS transporter [Burkholderiales bacterium]|nr:MFS transporter [Anaerolineae bacterium]